MPLRDAHPAKRSKNIPIVNIALWERTPQMEQNVLFVHQEQQDLTWGSLDVFLVIVDGMVVVAQESALLHHLGITAKEVFSDLLLVLQAHIPLIMHLQAACFVPMAPRHVLELPRALRVLLEKSAQQVLIAALLVLQEHMHRQKGLPSVPHVPPIHIPLLSLLLRCLPAFPVLLAPPCRRVAPTLHCVAFESVSYFSYFVISDFN
jgi:hypothetical protein